MKFKTFRLCILIFQFIEYMKQIDKNIFFLFKMNLGYWLSLFVQPDSFSHFWDLISNSALNNNFAYIYIYILDILI